MSINNNETNVEQDFNTEYQSQLSEEEKQDQQPIDTFNEPQDMPLDGSESSVINRKRGLSGTLKPLLLAGGLAGVLFLAPSLTNLTKPKEKPTEEQKTDTLATTDPINTEATTEDMTNSMDDLAAPNVINNGTPEDQLVTEPTMTEEEFRQSLQEDTSTAPTSFDSIDSGNSVSDYSSYGQSEQNIEDTKEKERSEKRQAKRDSAIDVSLTGGESTSSNQTSNQNNTNSQPQPAQQQYQEGTYTVDANGNVTKLPSNNNPFAQTNPNITGRGAAGYGSQTTNNHNVNYMQSPYVVSTGQIIPAVLDGGINSLYQGMARARVTKNVYDTKTGKYLLIPQGSVLIGEYSPFTDGANFRIITLWNRIIFPNGKSINLTQYTGTDLRGYAGMKAQVNTHFWKKLGNAVASTLTAITYSFADRLTIEDGKVKLMDYSTSTSSGSSGDRPNTLGEVFSAIEQRASQKNQAIQTSLRVKEGTTFNVRINTDLILDTPYK